MGEKITANDAYQKDRKKLVDLFDVGIKEDFLEQMRDLASHQGINEKWHLDAGYSIAAKHLSRCLSLLAQHTPPERLLETLRKFYTSTGIEPTIMYDTMNIDFALLIEDIQNNAFSAYITASNLNEETWNTLKVHLQYAAVSARNGLLCSGEAEHWKHRRYAGEHLALAMDYIRQASPFYVDENVDNLEDALGFKLYPYTTDADMLHPTHVFAFHEISSIELKRKRDQEKAVEKNIGNIVRTSVQKLWSFFKRRD